MICFFVMLFVFKQKTAYELRMSDWSSDVCSSDLRLGSNSLIDLVVFGRATGKRIAETVKPNTPHDPLPKGSEELALGRLDHFRNADGKSPTADIRVEMQKTIQRHAEVFRNDELLGEGVTEIAKVYQRMQDVHVTDRSLIWNTDLVETLELDNVIAKAVATMNAAE